MNNDTVPAAPEPGPGEGPAATKAVPAPVAESVPDPELDPVTEAWLEVTHRLHGFSPFDAETLDGFLTGLASAPRELDALAATRELVGEDWERCFADPADAAAAERALGAYVARIREQLMPAEGAQEGAGLLPYMLHYDEEARAAARADGAGDQVVWLYDGAGWADGWRQGVAAADAQVELMIGARLEAAMTDCAAQVLALTLGDRGEPWERHVRQWWKGKAPSRDRLIDSALDAAEEFCLLWRDAALTPAPLVAAFKPGRNDPCPCGSGKKYKKCHGADA